MKKLLKTLVFFISTILICLICVLIFYYIQTKNVKIDDKKFINLNKTITYYDSKENILREETNGIAVTDFENINKETINAFISIEDKRFYSHNGIDYKGILRAIYSNVKSKKLKEGASTITQQLIKNTHLSSEKTLKRKLSEIKLSKLLEKKFTKEKILETYLNTIYFGSNCYGITSACEYYFNKTPKEINLNESAILASIIKSPRKYSPYFNIDNCTIRKNLVLKNMYQQNYITRKEYEENINNDVNVVKKTQNTEYDYFNLIRQELNNIIDNSPYENKNLSVFTTIESEKQEILVNNQIDDQNMNKSAILLGKNGKIIAYYSNHKAQNRQLGSIIKPLIVYAPAIEKNLYFSSSKILDEKTNFNGYSPKNYNNKYYGYVTFKDSLVKSLNVCAVKILNTVGVENAKKYLNKTEIKLTKNDNSLALALGSTEKGAQLKDITACYSIFNDSGYYSPCYIIDKIENNGKIIYKKNNFKSKIFEEGTVSVINDALKDVVECGTAKKLYNKNIPLYAKTGTVGNSNGNSDTYTISFNSDYILGSYLGKKDNLLNNSITGGTLPATISNKIWQDIYKNKKAPDYIKLSGACEIEIDKISLDVENEVVLADEISPNRYKEIAIFKKNNIPKIKSTRFSNPKIEKPILSVFFNRIKISLCLPQYYNLLVYRYSNNQKTLIYNNKDKNENEIFDLYPQNSKKIYYGFIPYYQTDKKTYFGKEIYSNKIKTPRFDLGENWWDI